MLVTVALTAPPVRHGAEGPAQESNQSESSETGARSAALILISEG